MTGHLVRVKARMSIHAHRKVRGLLQGEYASMQVGRSHDFNDLREYVRGDDVRDLDWKASARTGELRVKRFVATREHTILLVVSTGRSMAAVNDRGVSKQELATFVAGVFGWLAVRNGDFVAVAYGDQTGCHLRPAGKGELRLERSLGAIHDAIRPDGAATDVAGLLEQLARLVRRRTIMVVLCDEYALDDRFVDALRRTRAQHEVLLVTLADLDPTRERDEPLSDVDTGGLLPTWASGDGALAQEYAAMLAADATRLRDALDRLSIAHERVDDHDAAVPAIFRLLQRHRRGYRR